MSDVIVLISILWACVMTALAMYYRSEAGRHMRGAMALCEMMSYLGDGTAQMVKTTTGYIFKHGDKEIHLNESEE